MPDYQPVQAGLATARDTGAPFARFDARIGWPLGPPPSHRGVLDDGNGLVLGLAGRSPISDTEPFGSFGGRTLPRGLAITEDGWILLADPLGREILVGRAGTGAAVLGLTPLWPARPLPVAAACDVAPVPHPPADPYTLVRPTDVAFSPAGDLVIADAGAGRLLVLAFPTAQLRRVVGIAGGAPTALAFDRHGRCLVADPVTATLHRFDTSWRRDPTFPHPSVTLTAPEHVAAIRPGCGGGGTCGCASDGVGRPGAQLVVLDRSRVVGLDDRGRLAPLPRELALEPAALRLDPDGTLRHDDPAQPQRDPMRITGLALTREGRHAQTGLPVIARPRRVARPRSGELTTLPLDGGRPVFSWDRVLLRARIPAATRLLISTLTSDSAVEFDRALSPDAGWSAPLAVAADEPTELLVQSAPGRYLWLRIELFGDGTATPRIEGIDVFGPRRSSVRFLPAAFHQDPESLRFLDRLLSYFDTVFAEISAAHGQTAALLDPWAVPEGAALDWLGSWFDLDFLAEWGPDVRRRMIAEAVGAARRRGTVAGLKRIVQHHTGLADPMPQVIEHFRLPDRPVPIAGEPLAGPPTAHTATLVLPAAAVPDAAARTRIERLVAEHTPAHVRVELRLVPAGITVGHQSTVGVDTLLGPPSSGVLGAGRLGADLVTAAARPEGLVPAPPHPSRRSQPCPPKP